MKNLYRRVPLGLFIIVAFFTSPLIAFSEEMPVRGPIPFSIYDKDKNGLISEEEFTSVREERISQRANENRPMRGMKNAPAFSDFDTNSDGNLSSDELKAGQQLQMQKRRGMNMGKGMNRGKGRGKGKNMPSFSDFDLNGDGVLLEEEFYDARNKRVAEREKQGYQMKNLVNAPSFEDIDTNDDEKISKEEFTAHQAERCREKGKK